MNEEDMIDGIESTNANNMWILIESCTNAKERFQMRDVFFQALKNLQIHYDMPLDTWH